MTVVQGSSSIEIPNVESTIVLATLNARYIHSAFGLRYLKANLGEYESQCEIKEYTLESRPEDVVESILQVNPRVVGFGVYIWNVTHTEKVVALLKAVSPNTVIVLGGPEVSYEQEGQVIVGLADYVITGWGEVSFRKLVHSILQSHGQAGATALSEQKVLSEPTALSEQKVLSEPTAGNELESSSQISGTSGRQITDDTQIIAGEQPKLDAIRMPYHLYDDQDIKHRVLYVEASRGCPFKCEFCLSALDKTAWPFDLDLFLEEMDVLHQRGARHFKFVDRTFNLKIKNSLRIMEFFLERMTDDLFLHFEVVPDHLPEALKEMIARFPAGQLQFEVGIQTFNQDVQSKISRRQDNQKAETNIKWIRNESKAYLHTDLIFGLPGETLESFAQSFDKLVSLNPHEIQVGILKRLKGSPIIRHTQQHRLVFNPNPPYSIASSDLVSFSEVQFIGRFARCWDLIANSGRFKETLSLILADNPFANFSLLTKALFSRTGQTYKISLLRLFDLVHDIGAEELKINDHLLKNVISNDFAKSGLKSIPKCLIGDINKRRLGYKVKSQKGSNSHSARQGRH